MGPANFKNSFNPVKLIPVATEVAAVLNPLEMVDRVEI